MCRTLEGPRALTQLISWSDERSSGPYYLPVNPIGAAIVALVVGLGIGVLLTWAAAADTTEEPTPTFDVAEPVVPVGVAEVLAVLTSSGIVVGPHDEVLEATTQRPDPRPGPRQPDRGTRAAPAGPQRAARGRVPAYRRPADLPGRARRLHTPHGSRSHRWTTT